MPYLCTAIVQKGRPVRAPNGTPDVKLEAQNCGLLALPSSRRERFGLIKLISCTWTASLPTTAIIVLLKLPQQRTSTRRVKRDALWTTVLHDGPKTITQRVWSPEGRLAAECSLTPGLTRSKFSKIGSAHGREKLLLNAMVKAVLNARARLIVARGCGACWKRWDSVYRLEWEC